MPPSGINILHALGLEEVPWHELPDAVVRSTRPGTTFVRAADGKSAMLNLAIAATLALADEPVSASKRNADSASDRGTDSDGGSDTGSDSGSETGNDSGSDTGSDSGSDIGSDSGSETGSDSGSDTEDGGTRAGVPPGWQKTYYQENPSYSATIDELHAQGCLIELWLDASIFSHGSSLRSPRLSKILSKLRKGDRVVVRTAHQQAVGCTSAIVHGLALCNAAQALWYSAGF